MRDARVQLTRRLVPVLASALMIAALGCRDDAESPTAPTPAPALATTASAPLSFYQMSAGYDRTCGVTTDDRAYCWGYNSQGQLGDGSTTNRLIPVAVVGGHSFHQISAGFGASCGVTTDHRAYCWGANERGELGDGTTTQRTTPVLVAGGHQFRQIETNFQHTCAVSYPDHRAYCWGDNSDGQLGDGTRTNRLKPVAVAGTLSFRQVTTGYYHSCGVTTNDQVYCWGANRSGQIGDSSTAGRRPKPTRVAGTRQYRQVDAGSDYTCAVTTDSRAFCWGNGTQGQLGNGKTYLSFWPKAVAGGHSFDRVTAAYTHTCGESASDQIYCWGLNYNGQFGDGTTTPSLKPVAAGGSLRFAQVSAGISHTCGKTAAAVGYCWGRGFSGQLGDGGTGASSTPVAVAGPK